MKNFKRINMTLISTILTLSMSVSLVSAVPKSQANKHKPIKAEDVQLIKKGTVKGKVSGERGKKTNTASTGIIDSLSTITGNKYAVLIGISDYPGTANDLQYSDDDAVAMQNVLINQYGFDNANITVLLNKDATYSNIIDAILSLKATLTPNDELVFFYSGHGASGRADDGDNIKTDQSIVVCSDDYTDINFIWDGELKQLFAEFPTDHIMFTFDSCLSGGMSVLNAPGRVVNMGCSSRGVCYEGEQWNGGQFTYYFVVNGMGLKYADTSADAIVSDEEAFDYAKANCIWQTPTIADGVQYDYVP